MMEFKETMSITEMRDKIKETEAGKSLQEMVNSGYYDFEEANLFGTGHRQREEGIQRIGREDAAKIVNTMKMAPLKEFLAKSGTTGIMGAAYLVPVKLHQVLYDAAYDKDITSDISMNVLGPEAIPGSTLDVAIVGKDESTAHDALVPAKYSPGGEIPDSATRFLKATLDFSSAFGYRFEVARDLIEDSQWDLFENFLKNAGGSIGEYASNLAIDVAQTGTDGDGTLNTSAAGNNTTLMVDVLDGYKDNIVDRFVPDIFVTSPEAWFDALVTDTTYTAYASNWHDTAFNDPVRTGFTLLGMKVLWTTVSNVQTDEAGTPQIHSLLMRKDSSLLTGRKRWMRIENYNEARRDLAGVTVTCRQDSVSIYNDSICTVEET